MKFLQVLLISSFLVASASWAADQATPRGAELHAAKGVQCQACHGDNGDIPSVVQCAVCHPVDALSEKTKDLQPTNPHAAPHNAECTGCHHMHEESVNYCALCHLYDFEVK